MEKILLINLKIKSKKYGRKTIFNDTSLELPYSGLTFLEGKNSSGKSTLLKIIMGRTTHEGEYLLNNKNVDKNTDYNSLLSNVTLNDRILPYLSLIDNVLFLYEEKDVKKAEEILDELGLLGIKDQKAKSLSVGEKRRLNIAISLYSNKHLFLDEPFASVDKENRIKILSVLEKYAKSHLVFIINHEKLVDTENIDATFYTLEKKKIVLKKAKSVFENDEKAEENSIRKEKSNPKLVFSSMKHHVLFILLFVFFSVTFVSTYLGSSYFYNKNSTSDKISERTVYESYKKYAPYYLINYPSEDKFKDNDYFMSVYRTNSDFGFASKFTTVPVEGMINDIMFIKEKTIDGLYEITNGRYPSNNNEIMIPESFFNYYLGLNVVSSFDDLVKRNIEVKPFTQSFSYKIVGTYANRLDSLSEEPLKSSLTASNGKDIYGLYFGAVSLLDQTKEGLYSELSFSNYYLLNNHDISYYEGITNDFLMKNPYTIGNKFDMFPNKENLVSDLFFYIAFVGQIITSLILGYLYIKWIGNDYQFLAEHKRVSNSSFVLLSALALIVLPFLISIGGSYLVASFYSFSTLNNMLSIDSIVLPFSIDKNTLILDFVPFIIYICWFALLSLIAFIKRSKSK